MVVDARKSPWYLDLTPSEMEEVITLVPLLLEVARNVPRPLSDGEWDNGGHMGKTLEALERLDAQHPGWRTWLVVEQEGRK